MKYDNAYDMQLKQLLNEHFLTAGKILKSHRMKTLYDYVMQCTSFLQDENLTTRIFYVINHQTKKVCCLTCGKPLKFGNVKNRRALTFRDAFNKFCCPRCECLNDEVKNKTKQTNFKKYGCDWSFQSDNNKHKSKKTMLNKYGCEYAQQNKNIKNKSYCTMLKKYGVKFTAQSNELLKKVVTSRRASQYHKYLTNEFVKPLFSKEEYIEYGDNKPYKWKCMKCNTEFEAFRNETWFKEGAVKAYARCEKCFPLNFAGTSYLEKEVYEFVHTLTAAALSKKLENRKIISPFELDIYIPDKKLAIEFDGLYWHSDTNNVKNTYHLSKTELCEKQGIQLIHIFENEWLLKQDIVKSRLKNLLGIYDKTVYARKCEVREVPSKESKAFQEANHLQGAVNSKVNLGLYYENELVSLMTFGKCRFDKKHEWEMLRFCNKLGYHIPGGAGKLLKHFEQKYKPKSLVTYADRRWSQGKLYKALGFKFDHASTPNYWYWKSTKLESRQKFQKHKLKNILENYDENLSEYENMKNNGYHRIFDCGNLVFCKTFV